METLRSSAGFEVLLPPGGGDSFDAEVSVSVAEELVGAEAADEGVVPEADYADQLIARID